ncbi:tyrosine-type recombinase/integrase [Alicycliphilus denitrificans]|uniref:Tyrosine-type recombinase/integrase n=1 Tax=Alicycliphilus denitrificans TaxID=179636 RepID=A0A858ZY26_9BURK|nr:site-specific integrase [Alicycliphilus denitrificans]QKD45738.1 tyrosine-type recombinase/integrase [Alicycliphilus denitrificans]
MSTISRSHCTDTDWLAGGPIGPYVGAFKQFLIDHQYAVVTSVSYLAGVMHFARWARGRRLSLRRIDEAAVVEFLDDHLPHCRCTGSVRHDRSDHRAALGHLLKVLRAQGAIALPAVSTRPVDEELQSYDEYMAHARGLAPKTRSIVLRIVGRLLTARFGDSAVDIAAIRPEHIRRFFAQQAKLYSKPAGAGAVVSALRGYFRYRASLGDAVHGGLVSAIAYPANWALSSLPKTLSTEEVERLIASLGQPGRAMRRADAIVRCALDLGLRSGEVARLSLDDIDWRAGTVTLRQTKGRREDVLPLPATTGAAIAAYLKHERPKTPSRAVFVRNVAPRDVPVGPDLVRKTIRQAYGRAGLPYTRSHLLRHTMANRLLAGGSSLKEVADVLRHRSLDTTMIYAKLDSRTLIEVALPWPGSAA